MTSTRRELLLDAGTLALFGGLAPARVSRAASADATRAARGGGRARHCILVYLVGGPSHLDMWDLKPHAPAEIRGPFKPIASSVPGVFVSEHLPRLARQANRLAIVRSLTYPNHDHPYMMYYTLTGRVSQVPLGANTVLPPSPQDHPHMGSVVARFGRTSGAIPAYVAIPEVRVRMQPVLVAGGGRAGFLGPRYDPLAVNDDPSQPPPALQLRDELDAERQSRRNRLLAVLDGNSHAAVDPRSFRATRDAAARLLESAARTDLFALDREPAALRDRYGRDRFGQSLLLARRLVERDVSFVAIHFNFMSKCDGWDTHARNFECLSGELLPMLDRGLSALLADLSDRGLLDETLVVTMGEFGRTPRINAEAGRDHWGHCASVVFAGGGVHGGRVVGASDRIAAYPTDSPIGPPDVVATIYHTLGLEPQTTMIDPFLNRPMTLCDGEPIASIL